MVIFTKSLSVFVFSFCLFFLFPDNSLLAQDVKQVAVENQNQDPLSNYLIFRKNKDEVKFNQEHLQSVAVRVPSEGSTT